MRSHWERIIRGLGVLTLIVFCVASLTPASNIISRRMNISSEIEPCGAIVVLGGGLMKGGVLSEESMRRVIRGIELYKQEFAPLIILSGRGRSDEPKPTEAEVRANLAVDMGISPEAIFKEETANTTREESIHIAGFLRQRNIVRILLVTEPLHMRRAKLVFERAGLRVLPAVSADYSTAAVSPGERLWLTTRLFQETAALIYYRIAGYI